MSSPEHPVTSDDIAIFVRRGHRRYLVRGWITVVVCLVLSSALLGGALVLRSVVAVTAFTSDGPATSPGAAGTTSASPSSSASSRQSATVTDTTPKEHGSEDKLAPPGAPTGFTAVLDDSFNPEVVLLEWDLPKIGSDIDYHEILRDGESVKGVQIFPPEHGWKDEYDGVLHEYRVRAIAVNGLTSLSEPQKPSLSEPPPSSSSEPPPSSSSEPPPTSSSEPPP